MVIKEISGNKMSIKESMEQCLIYFEEAIRSACMPPEEVYKEFDEYAGAAWELRQELLSGRPLVDWHETPESKRVLISKIIEMTEKMPAKAIDGTGVAALLEPSWTELRNIAIAYREELMNGLFTSGGKEA